MTGGATPAAEPQLYFGKYKGQPLADVPASYLRWVLGAVKLSSGTRNAVAAELARRGLDAPPPAPPRTLRPCPEHPAAGHLLYWCEDSLGRRGIRAECRRCRRIVDRPPLVEPYTGLADLTADATPVLTALVRLDDLGVELESDGRSVWLQCEDYRRVSRDLHAVIKQCSHTLARMLGDTRRRAVGG